MLLVTSALELEELLFLRMPVRDGCKLSKKSPMSPDRFRGNWNTAGQEVMWWIAPSCSRLLP